MIRHLSCHRTTGLPWLCWLLLLCGCRHVDEARQPVSAPIRAQSASTAPVPQAAPQPTAADLAAAQKAVRAAPHDGKARFDLGLIQVARGQVPEGVASLREAARLAPNSAAPDAYLVRIYQQAGYIDWEIEALRHLVAIHSTDPKVYLRLAQIYIQLEWLDPAGPMIRRALQLSSDAPDVQREMARYEFESGQTHAAIQRLQDLHRRVPADPLAASLLAQYLITLDGDREAETAIRETLRLNPDNATLKLLLAHTLEHENRPETLPEAATLAQDVLKTAPRNVEAYCWLAQSEERMQHRDEAQRAYQAAANIDPSFENVALKLGQMDLRTGQRAEGERLAHLYEKINSNMIAYGVARDYVHHHFNDPTGHINVAGWYTKMKSYPNAIAEYKEALRLRPDDSATRKQLLATLIAGGRTREAQRMRSTGAQ